MRVTLPFIVAVLATACGGDAASGGGSGGTVTRDSAGIAITEYGEAAIAEAPAWQLSAEPLAVIQDDDPAGELDLSTAALGAMLSDGRVVVATAQPAQIHLFNTDGSHAGTIGRTGEGPGEFRFLQQVLALPGDTIYAFEIARRKGVRYLPDGTFLDEADFPLPEGRPIPPLMRGRLDNGTFIHSGEAMLPQAPGGDQKIFRMDLPIFALAPGATDFDTVVVTQSAQMFASSVSAMGQTMPMARPVAFGPTPLIAAGGTAAWISTGDVAELAAWTPGDSAPHRLVRFTIPPREVQEADRTRYKEEAKAALEQFRDMMPPGMLESELQKVDETLFAGTFPKLGQLVIAKDGALWVGSGAPFGDALRQWMVLSPTGELLGTVTLPEGNLVAAAADRVVVRREDDATGMVRLEVWGVER